MPPIKVATRIRTVKAARAETERTETKARAPAEAVPDRAAVRENRKVAAVANATRGALA